MVDAIRADDCPCDLDLARKNVLTVEPPLLFPPETRICQYLLFLLLLLLLLFCKQGYRNEF